MSTHFTIVRIRISISIGGEVLLYDWCAFKWSKMAEKINFACVIKINPIKTHSCKISNSRGNQNAQVVWRAAQPEKAHSEKSEMRMATLTKSIANSSVSKKFHSFTFIDWYVYRFEYTLHTFSYATYTQIRTCVCERVFVCCFRVLKFLADWSIFFSIYCYQVLWVWCRFLYRYLLLLRFPSACRSPMWLYMILFRFVWFRIASRGFSFPIKIRSICNHLNCFATYGKYMES